MTDLIEAAREAVLRQLGRAYDSHAEEEQILVYEGRYEDAEAEHVIVLALLNAYKAEAGHPQRVVLGDLTHTSRTYR